MKTMMEQTTATIHVGVYSRDWFNSSAMFCTFVTKTNLSDQYVFRPESDGSYGNNILHGAELMYATASKECFPTCQGIRQINEVGKCIKGGTRFKVVVTSSVQD